MATEEKDNYRYKTLYLYTSLEGLLKIIETGKLKVSLPWGTNDITEGIPKNEQQRHYQTESYGYICMSDICSSPAMWGYYAERGRGACLVMDIFWIEHQSQADTWVTQNPEKWTEQLPGKIVKVKYEATRPDFKTPEDILRYKSPDWKHESEYRYIIKLADCEFSKIIDTNHGKQGQYYVRDLTQYMKGIILGPNCELQPSDISQLVKKQASQSGISSLIHVVKAKLAKDTYSFVSQDEKSLSSVALHLVQVIDDDSKRLVLRETRCL